MGIEVIQEIENYIKALEKEVSYIQKDLKEKGMEFPLEVISGRLIERHSNEFVYLFEVKDFSQYIAPHTNVIYESCENRDHGYVVESYPEKNEILVELKGFIGESVKNGNLKFDMTFLYKELRNSLEYIIDNPRDYNIALLSSLLNRNHMFNRCKLTRKYTLNESQYRAIENAIGSNFCFIWGPPGTGKTTTIGALVNEFISQKNRVLILSHTNLAVDTVMNKTYQFIKKYGENRKIVRYGTPTLELNKNILTVERLIEKTLSKLGKDIEEVLSVYKPEEISKYPPMFLLENALKKPIPQYIKYKIINILEEVDNQIEQIIKSADIVGTTLSKLYIDKKLKNAKKLFDVAIVDEGSTALIPQIIYASLIISRKIVIVGDFNQLPCIAHTQGLKKEIFSKLNLNKVNEKFSERPILNIQYRMHPDICAIINQLFYGGQLRTCQNILKNVKTWPVEIKSPIGASLLIDTTNTDATCKIVGGTRTNDTHLEIIEEIIDNLSYAKEIEDNLEIGIITPYRGQSNKIKEIIRKHDLKNKIETSTVHSFQGQEKDIIIFDLVDAPYKGRYHVGFLNEYKNPPVKNLINVAISRAKKKLIIIAHTETFRRCVPSSIIIRLFDRIKTWGFIISRDTMFQSNIRSFFENIKSLPPTKRLYDIPEIKIKLKNATYVKWDGEFIPLFKLKGDDCIVEIKGKNREIPVYEVESFRRGGIEENLIFKR